MKTKRKSISKRIRFAVFARDNFTCRYCGAQSDSVQLVLDHIHPVCQGGSNEPENLVTSCEACNAGKSGNTIKQAALNDSHRLALQQEMREQMQALAAAKAAAEARNNLRQEVCNYYCQLRGVESVRTDSLNVLVSFVHKHGAGPVFEWMDIAARNLSPNTKDSDFVRYVCGIRRKILGASQLEASNA